MKNCDSDAAQLISGILNIVQHYRVSYPLTYNIRFSYICAVLQGIHTNCHSSSCKQPGYVSNKMMITDTKTAAAYEKKLTSTLIFRNILSFCRVCIVVDQCCNESVILYTKYSCSAEIHFGSSPSTTSF